MGRTKLKYINFSDEEYSKLKLNKGDKIEIIETMQNSGTIIL